MDKGKKDKPREPKVKGPKMTTPMLIKTLVFGALLAGAGCFMGLVLKWCGDDSVQLVAGSGDFWDILRLGCWALGALLTVAVAAGLIAVLIRSFWMIALMFLASAFALFLCWELSLAGFVVALIYFIIGLIYIANVRAEINDRIKFRVGNIRPSQGMFLTILVALICTGLYFGSARSIDRDGFSLSTEAVDWVVKFADEHIVDNVMPEEATAADRAKALTEVRDSVNSSAESYKDYAPMILAAIAFTVLNGVLFFVSWVPLVLLWLIFLILLRLKVVTKKTHSVEVTRLSIE